jgi:hypothetical protein
MINGVEIYGTNKHDDGNTFKRSFQALPLLEGEMEHLSHSPGKPQHHKRDYMMGLLYIWQFYSPKI